MKILVIKGSPNRKGSSNMLADEFIKGASEPDRVLMKLMQLIQKFHQVLGVFAAVMKENVH